MDNYSYLNSIRSCHASNLSLKRHHNRHRWTDHDLSEVIAALSYLRTSDIAELFGVNPKALRSMLRRRGIQLRDLRHQSKKQCQTKEGLGVSFERSHLSPHACYGATALVALERKSCLWPIGDPAEEGFCFCSKIQEARSSYCAEHKIQSIEPKISFEGDRL